MSIHEIAFEADQCVRLRQDIAGLRIALASLSEKYESLLRENQRLRDGIRLIVTETERHRLAVESHGREVAR